MQRRQWVAAVAKRRGVPLEELRRLNPGRDLDRVRPKETILVPKLPVTAGTPPPTAPLSAEKPPATANAKEAGGSEAGGVLEGLWKQLSGPQRRGRRDSLRSRSAGDVSRSKGPQPPQPLGLYTVRRGDSATWIAQEQGLTLSGLRALNPGVDLEHLWEGQHLQILHEAAGSKAAKDSASDGDAQETVEYMIRPGDYLGDVASRFGVDVDAVVQHNSLSYDDPIHVGQVVLIPLAGSSRQHGSGGGWHRAQVELHGPWAAATAASRLPASVMWGALVLALAGMGVVHAVTRAIRATQPLKGRKLKLNDAASLAPFGGAGFSGNDGGGPAVAAGGLLKDQRFGDLLGREPPPASLASAKSQTAGGQVEVSTSVKAPRPRALSVSEGYGEGASLLAAVQEARRSAQASMGSTASGTTCLLAVGQLWSGREDNGGGGLAGAALQEAMAAAWRLPGEEFHGMALVRSAVPGPAAAKGDAGATAPAKVFWAAVLLFAAPGKLLSVCASGSMSAVRDAAQNLRAKVSAGSHIKAVVITASPSLLQAALDEAADELPELPLFGITAGRKLAASDWLVPSAADPATHGSATSPQSPMTTSGPPASGVSLMAILTEAEFGGAFLASVIGSWLYGESCMLTPVPPLATSMGRSR
eukprot:SM000048S16509  [mRNA]  locus=s48:134558:137577:+ [translate_table: standard]